MHTFSSNTNTNNMAFLRLTLPLMAAALCLALAPLMSAAECDVCALQYYHKVSGQMSCLL